VVKTGRETLGVLAGREALAIALIVATTLSGLGSQRALAEGRPTPRAALRAAADPAEAVFAFGDDLEAVTYDLGDQRVAACRGVLAHQANFQSTLRAVPKADEVAGDLRAAAEPTIELCFDPLTSDEDAVGRAAEGYADFHERAFDFADYAK